MKRRKYGGYTFLELLVVMAIIAVLLYMLIQVIAAFRRNLELQQASDQITIGISETKNSSINNVLPDHVVPGTNEIYGYSLEVRDDRLVRILEVCIKDPITNHLNCSYSGTPIDLVNTQFLSKVKISASGCDNVLMLNLTGDIKLGNGGTYSDSSTCEFTLTHAADGRTFRVFVFDSVNNTTEIKYAGH